MPDVEVAKPDPHTLTINPAINEVDSDPVDWYEIDHPQRCAIWIGYRDGVEFDRRIECEVSMEIDNAGPDDIIKDLAPGRYHLRVNHVTLRGADWTEYDVEYEVEPINA